MPVQPTTQNQPNKTYAVSQSFWKSTDSGKTWQVKDTTKQTPTVTDWDVIRIEIDPTNSNIIYAGLKDGGIVKTEDGGDTWNFTNFVSGRPYAIEIDPGNNKVIYASGIWQKRGKMFKTEDQGATWKEIYTSPVDGPFITSSAMDKNDTQTLYIGNTDSQILKSTDGGSSWVNIYKANASISKIFLDKSDSNIVYVLTITGSLYRSRDAGQTFEDITSKIGGSGILTIAIDPGISQGVYAAGTGGMFRSKDAGDNWEKVNPLNDSGKYPITAIAINPQNSREIIYATSQAAYKSEDSGASWTPYQFTSGKYIDIIKYDPTNPSLVYVGFKK
jgi:photosystem II stability/assembly factor-like uncharacterized protein